MSERKDCHVSFFSTELAKCFLCEWVQALEILDGAFKTATSFSEERGSLACLANEDRHVILRHRFGWHFHVCGFQHGTGCDAMTRETMSMQIALACKPAQTPNVNVKAFAGRLAPVHLCGMHCFLLQKTWCQDLSQEQPGCSEQQCNQRDTHASKAACSS
jgi:hypothetical protein